MCRYFVQSSDRVIQRARHLVRTRELRGYVKDKLFILPVNTVNTHFGGARIGELMRRQSRMSFGLSAATMVGEEVGGIEEEEDEEEAMKVRLQKYVVKFMKFLHSCT